MAREVLETASRRAAVCARKGEKKSARWPESEWVENGRAPIRYEVRRMKGSAKSPFRRREDGCLYRRSRRGDGRLLGGGRLMDGGEAIFLERR